MKPTTLLCLLIHCCFAGQAQQVFFKSAQSFDKDNLSPFYSSVAVQDSLLLFNANDYQLYAYDKYSGQLRWQQYLGWKSNQAPFFVGQAIWAQKGENKMIQLDPRTGAYKELAALYSIETQPLVKDGIAYATGIYEGGCLLAYDLQADTVRWHRFLAHGCSVAPYYRTDGIIANAEGDHWLEIGYDGRLKQRGCDTVEVSYPSELPCTRRFAFLSHDGKAIAEDWVEKEFSLSSSDVSFYATGRFSFLAANDRLLVLGDRLKKKADIQLTGLPDSLDQAFYEEPVKILKVDDRAAWLLVSDWLLVYDYLDKKPVRVADLRSWQPHRVLVDGEKLWLISRSDGLLYGLSW